MLASLPAFARSEREANQPMVTVGAVIKRPQSIGMIAIRETREGEGSTPPLFTFLPHPSNRQDMQYMVRLYKKIQHAVISHACDPVNELPAAFPQKANTWEACMRMSVRLFVRQLSALLLALLLFLPMLPARSESNITLLFDTLSGAWKEDYSQQVAAVNDTLYISRSDGLYAYRTGDDAPARLMDFTKTDISGAAAEKQEYAIRISELLHENGTLYALDSGLENLWRFEESASVFVKEASFESPEMDGDHTEARWGYSGFLLDSGNIYYIDKAENAMSMVSNLMMLNTQTGKSDLVKTNVHLAVPYTKGTLLVVTGDMGYTEALSVLDPGTGRVTQKLALSGDYTGLGYDPATDTVYLVRKGEICISRSFQEPVTAARTPVVRPVAGGAPLPGGLFALPYEDGVRVYTADPSQLGGNTLTIAGNTQELPMEDFSKQNPEVSIVFSETYPANTMELVAHMQSGAYAADVYAVSSANYSLRDLYEKGYYIGLQDNELIADTVSAMYPYIQDAFIRDGTVIALPFDQYNHAYCYSPRAFEEAGLTKADVPKTYDGLLDFIALWTGEYAEKYPSLSLFGQGAEPDFCKRWLAMDILEARKYLCLRSGEPLTYNTPHMQALLQRLMAADFSAVGALMPVIPDAAAFSSPNYWPQDLFHLMNGISARTDYSAHYSGMPLALGPDDAPVIVNDIQMLIINPYTKNLAAALAFAEFAAKSLPPTLKTDMMPGENEPIPMPGFDLKQMEGTIERVKKRLNEAEEAEKREIQSTLDILLWEYEEQKKGMWWTTPESIAAYRELAPYLMPRSPNPIYGGGTGTELTDLFLNRFLQGQITPAQFLAELDQKVRMMDLEQ